MIEPFEAALADLLADRIGAVDAVQEVTRWSDGLPSLQPDETLVVVQVLDGELSADLGSDRDEELRRPGGIELRTSLRLEGRVRIAVEIGTASNPADRAAQRSVLMTAVDEVLAALHDDDVRTGAVWGDHPDQGFAIERFRLEQFEHATEPAEDFHRLDVSCRYRGRFWPVVPAIEGDVIEEPIRVRTALLDARLPVGLRARGGGPDVFAPVTLDLRAVGGAEPRLVARLAGAAPPGELVGDDTGVPPASVGYLPDESGRYRVVFRPAPALAASATARVVLSLSAPDRPTARVGEFEIQVEA